MIRFMCALILVLVLATPSFGQQSLVGTYKLVSRVVEVDGTPTQAMGKAPHGYIVFTPTHFIVFFTAENRKFGTSVDEKAALFDTLVGYAGTYRVEGDKCIQNADVSWAENRNGTTVVTTWQLSGNRLTITEGPAPYPKDPSKTASLRAVMRKLSRQPAPAFWRDYEMEESEDAHMIGSVGLRSLWSLLRPILSDKECYSFPVSIKSQKGGVLCEYKRRSRCEFSSEY